MHSHQDPISKFETLRQQAETLTQLQADIAVESPTDILGLIHELKVHQAELEIQNEELQRAQQEISALHREYRNLYEFAPCGYLTLNDKGIITHMNLTGSRLLDVTRNHVSRVGFSNCIESGWEGIYHSARERSAKTGQKQSIELPTKRKNDLPLWVRLEIEADRDEADHVIQWRIVLIDISEKKKSEEALEKSEARFRKMMESISDPLYVCSPDQTIEYLNPAMLALLGRNAMGEMCYKALHGLTETCQWCPFDKVRNGETIEESIVSPLDNRSYRVTHMPIQNDDRTVSKLSIYRDIQDYLSAMAEKEKVQAQLQQAQKMESIGNLAGGIAHDFNNILSSVIGFTELALGEVDRGTTLEENLQEVYTAGNRAKDLVTQILTFARKTNEEIKPIRINTIIRDCVKLLRASIPTTIDIKQELNSESLTLGNASLIQQTIMNLATNAMHAMENTGGVLTIRLSDVNIDKLTAEKHHLQKSGDYIRISVSDTGTGIPPEAIQSVFEPYFTTKETGKGTGMGLALVHGTAKKYGGAVMVDSHPGLGTTFTILLPVTEKLENAAPYPSPELPRGTERILFVDDELSIAKMTKRRLETLGYHVTIRTSSVEALELFQATSDEFDLVITDMTMPNLTGDKLAVELIKIRRDIPVILCTGYSNKISEENASEFGIKAFAYKPIVAADLAKIVLKVLDEARSIR